jgi:hypothetical protein
MRCWQRFDHHSRVVDDEIPQQQRQLHSAFRFENHHCFTTKTIITSIERGAQSHKRGTAHARTNTHFCNESRTMSPQCLNALLSSLLVVFALTRVTSTPCEFINLSALALRRLVKNRFDAMLIV